MAGIFENAMEIYLNCRSQCRAWSGPFIVQLTSDNRPTLFFCLSSSRRSRPARSNLGTQDSTTSEEETQKSTYTATVKSRFERKDSTEKKEDGSRSEQTSSMDESERDSQRGDEEDSGRRGYRSGRSRDEIDRAAPRTQNNDNVLQASKNRLAKYSDKPSEDIKGSASPVCRMKINF